MADNNIDIAIKTTGDTAGADKVDASIKKINGTVSVSTMDDFLTRTASKAKVAEFAFYDLDAEVTRTGNSGEKLDPLITKINRIPPAIKPAADGMKNFGGFVNQAGFQVTDFAVQVQGGTSAITAFSQQFPQLIGSVQQSGLELGKIEGGLAALPIGIGTAISIGAVAIGVGVSLAADAYAKMKKAQDDLRKSEEEHQKLYLFMAQQRLLLSNQIREEFILSIYTEQAEQLERQEKALTRLNELRAAQGSAAQAQADAAVTAAQNNGGNVFGAKGNAMAVGVDNQIDALQGKLQTSQQAVTQAVTDLENADRVLAEFRARNDQYSDGYIKADEAFKKATKAKEDATLELENQKAIFDAAIVGIAANTEASLNTLTTEANAAQTKAARDALIALEKKSAEVGGNISSSAKQAMEDLRKVLLDGMVKPDEMRLVTDAINQARAAREGADKEIMAAMSKLTEISATVLNELPALRGRIEGLYQQAQSQNQ